MFGIDNVYRLKLYMIQIKTKCLQTSETDKFSSNLLSVFKSCILTSCVHYEQTLDLGVRIWAVLVWLKVL